MPMRSELVNGMDASKEAKILLRSLIEAGITMKWLYKEVDMDPSLNEACKEVNLDYAFRNSDLLFTDGIRAFEELYKLNLVALVGKGSHCDVYIKNVLQYIKDCMDAGGTTSTFFAKRYLDYQEVKGLLAKMKLESEWVS